MKLGFNPTTMRLLALVVVVAMAATQDELAKEMTHGSEMTYTTLAIAIAMFWCGWLCGAKWAWASSTRKAKVFVYKKGKRYHTSACTATPSSSHATRVTVTQACEAGMTPCKCAACERCKCAACGRAWACKCVA